MSDQLIVSMDERRLNLEERQIALEERRVANEARGQRTADEIAFDLEMRMATSLAQSPFLPEKVGSNPAERIAAAWGVLRFAKMLGVDPYVLAQQIYVVHGRVGFSAQFLIALVNNRGGLTRPIDWTVSGSWQTGDLTVTCTATDGAGNERAVTMTKAQIDKWGWAAKSGEPWKADPVLMMRYRTASQLIRLYFAGAVMGLTMTAEELRDIERAEVEVVQRPAPVSPMRQISEGPPARDFVAEAEELERQRAARVSVEAGEGGEGGNARTEPTNPLAGVPDPTGDWITALAEEVQTDTASIVAYLRSVERDPATMSPQQSGATKLALGASGSKRADLLAFVGRK